MKKFIKLIMVGVLLSFTCLLPARAFKLQELPRDQAEQICQRLVYLWNDDTGIPVSRFKPLTDEVMVVKAIYAAKQNGSEEFFQGRTENPDQLQTGDSNQNVMVDVSKATQYFFGREASVDTPESAYFQRDQLKQEALPYTVHVKTISPNVGPRMYIVAYIADGKNENGEPNFIGRIDATVEPNEDAPLDWSVLQYEISKLDKEQAIEQEEPVVEKVTFSADAFFDFDKSIIKPEGQEKLDELVSNLQNRNYEAINVVGHTDSIGSEAYNDKLSLRRSDAVKAYLVSKGIDSQKIFAEGKGETQPVEDNKTKEGRAKNRRVEIEVITNQGTPQ